VLIPPDGTTQTKSQLLADMKSGDLVIESSERSDMEVRAYGDAAVVTYMTNDKGKYKSRTPPRERWRIHGDSVRWRSTVAGGDVRPRLGLDLRNRYDERRLFCERWGRQPDVGTFPITVIGAADQIAALQRWVEKLKIDTTLQRQLVSALEKAGAAAASGNSQTACKQLATVVSLVNKAGNELTNGYANKILNRNCQCVPQQLADHFTTSCCVAFGRPDSPGAKGAVHRIRGEYDGSSGSDRAALGGHCRATNLLRRGSRVDASVAACAGDLAGPTARECCCDGAVAGFRSDRVARRLVDAP
jgi:hypothetical protein